MKLTDIKEIKITLPVWLKYLFGVLLPLALPIAIESYGLRSYSLLCFLLAVLLWEFGGILGVGSWRKGGWITLGTMAVQCLLIFWVGTWQVLIFTAMPGLIFYWKLHKKASKTALVSLHLNYLAMLLYFGCVISEVFYPSRWI